MPTPSTLVKSNKLGSEMLGKPLLLLILQPDKFMEAVLDEMHIVQSVNTQVKILILARVMLTAVLEWL